MSPCVTGDRFLDTFMCVTGDRFLDTFIQNKNATKNGVFDIKYYLSYGDIKLFHSFPHYQIMYNMHFDTYFPKFQAIKL